MESDHDNFLKALRYMLQINIPGKRNTQAALAEHAGVSREHLNRMLRGKRPVGASYKSAMFDEKVQEAIAGYYNSSLEDFLKFGDEVKDKPVSKGLTVPMPGVGRPRTNPYPDEQKFTVWGPASVHHAVKLASAETGKPMARLIIEALIEKYGGGEIIDD